MPNKPETLRAELRYSANPMLQRRRAVVGLSVFSAGILGGIALFQIGIFKKLPDPPLRRFDSDAVNASTQAYSLLQTPDALLGMTSYAVTACLAAAGSQDRFRTARWIPLAMGAKTALDVALAGRLAVQQWTKFRKFSFWSLVVAGATLAALPLAVPEARRAWRS